MASKPPKNSLSSPSVTENANNDCINTKPKRNKGSYVSPPSALHPDVHPPSLRLVQNALGASKSLQVKTLLPPPKHRISDLHDDQGRMILHGTSHGRYAGDLIGGLPHGFGRHWIPTKMVPSTRKLHLIYEGDWENGTKTGMGSVFYLNGQEYHGEVKDGERCGRGFMRYKDGSVYIGDWLKDRKHGLGTLYYPSGKCYQGAFCKDQRCGWGAFYWPSTGRKFEGEWVSNNPFSGCYYKLSAEEFDALKGDIVPSLFSSLNLPSTEEKEIPEVQLRHPFWTLFNVICSVRKLSASTQNTEPLFQTQVGRKETLSSAQLQAIKHAFESLAPSYLHLAKLLSVHFRRLLVNAQIDPDKEQGMKLLSKLHLKAQNSGNSSFDNLLLSILEFHNP